MLKFENEYVISIHTLLGMCPLFHAGITVNPCNLQELLMSMQLNCIYINGPFE